VNKRLRTYVDWIRAGLTPNVPATFRPEVFEALTTKELDAYLARLRR
jgi:hypothetical protein